MIAPRPENWSYENSVFWKCIKESDNSELKLAVREIASSAKSLSKLILKELPSFTLHDEIHLNNVLYWMEQFVTKDGLDELGPVGCALCITLAYTHDLGMVPEPGWKDSLADPDTHNSVRFKQWAVQRHVDLLDLVDHCRASGEHDRVDWIEGFLRVDYLRATHADEGHESRVAAHLRRLDTSNEVLKKTFGFIGDTDEAIDRVSLLAASHNRSADWLARRLEKRGSDNSYWKLHAKAGTTNLLLPALLLRLADICDFDSSRTPRILFQQIGLEGLAPLGLGGNVDGLASEQARATATSVKEWMKHLAIDRWEWDCDGYDGLVYVSSCCPHPAVERSLLDFRDVIRQEVSEVRNELSRVFKHENSSWLSLPREVSVKVETRRGYVFHDVNFKLKAHEVTQLLMGTALYGNSELCIRELLQNALDAVQLRDLRLKLKRKLENKGEDLPDFIQPVDPWNTEERTTPIRLEWGHDDSINRDWISVRDVGVGMTLDQINRYLSALGRSYYKSPEFSAEARLMREHGLLATPISQFGIGVLSCFMVAEWIDIRTCPCGHDEEERCSWRIKITGPGSLFHFTERKSNHGETIRAGTEVRLYLKRQFALADMPRDELIDQLREQLDYRERLGRKESPEGMRDEIRFFNPAAVAARHVIWPRHPILCQAASEDEALLVLDDKWHFTELCPIDQAALVEKASQWGCPEGRVADAQWHYWDWSDDDETGSRIRIAFPRSRESRSSTVESPFISTPSRARVVELASFIEGKLPSNASSRQRYLVCGMAVSDLGVNARAICQAAAGVGAFLWVDLTGAVGPRMTADRTRLVPLDGESGKTWSLALDSLFDRWIGTAGNWAQTSIVAFKSIAHVITRLRNELPGRTEGNLWSLRGQIDLSWNARGLVAFEWVSVMLILESARSRDRSRDRSRARSRARFFARDLDLTRAFDRVFDLARDRDRVRVRDLALALDLARVLVRARDLNHNLALNLDRDRDRARARDRARSDIVRDQFGDTNKEIVLANFINEGFWPSLTESFPLLRLPHAEQGLQAASQSAPSKLVWTETKSTLSFENGLEAYDYDLGFPITTVALSQLRQDFPQWYQDRDWRRLLVFPFLGSDEALVANLSKALVKPQLPKYMHRDSKERIERIHAEARKLSTLTIHALLPREDLWEKEYVDWTEEDWRWCGYTAQWNIAKGEMLWAIGAVHRDEMPTRGLRQKEFLKSDLFLAYKEKFPELFPKSK